MAVRASTLKKKANSARSSAPLRSTTTNFNGTSHATIHGVCVRVCVCARHTYVLCVKETLRKRRASRWRQCRLALHPRVEGGVAYPPPPGGPDGIRQLRLLAYPPVTTGVPGAVVVPCRGQGIRRPGEEEEKEKEEGGEASETEEDTARRRLRPGTDRATARGRRDPSPSLQCVRGRDTLLRQRLHRLLLREEERACHRPRHPRDHRLRAACSWPRHRLNSARPP